MDTDSVKAFNAELTSVYDSKPPLSKKKIQDIAKVALKAKSYYKHVVFSVEKFLAKCKIEYKIPCLYVIDSIIRTSKHQLKEKDVFASRFLKNFSKTLSDLLSCPVCDQPRVVRTLNLWSANGVYTEEQLAPFKQQCRDMGIDTDIERVERLVKGDDADMSRYGGAYGRAREKEKKKHRGSAPASPHSSSHVQQHNLSIPVTSTTPPLPTSSHPVSAVPHVLHDSSLDVMNDPDNEPSDEIPPCGLSERKLLDMMLDANFDFSGAFKNDIVLLRKAHGLICRALDARIRAVGDKPEIKELLSSQFDYSDEEDDGEESKKVKRPVTKVCQEDLLSIARNLIEDPNVIAAFRSMHAERILSLNQIAAQTQQRTQPTSNSTVASSLPSSAQIQAANLPRSLSAGVSLPQNVSSGLTSIAGLPGVQSLQGLQNLAGLQSLNLAQLTALNSATVAQPNQALLNILANNSLVSKIGTLSNLQFANARATTVPMAGGLDTNQLAKQQELLQQLAKGGKTTLGGVPPPSSLGLLGAAPAQLLGPLPTASLAMLPDDNESDKDIRKKDRKRSRSRDRGDHKKRRSRSRERKCEKVDRERRKLGLPAVQEGITISKYGGQKTRPDVVIFVASKTLWFGRLPINCSENDIRSAIAGVGEISKVNLIGSRACAYATMTTRKAAYDVLQKLARDLQIARKNVKVDWAKGTGMKENELAKYWDAEHGISEIPWDQLPSNMERFCEGSYLDVETLPPEKRHMYLDTGALTTAPPVATQSKTDTSSPSSPNSMHASPIKSIVPDSPAALAPMPQAVPPPAAFPSFMGAPHRPNPFMGPPPQMVPPPGFPMRLPMPPNLPSPMPPGMSTPMFGMPPGAPGSIMMPPPGVMPPPTSVPPPASMPQPVPGVSGVHAGQMRPSQTLPGTGPPSVPPSHFSPPGRGGFGGGGSGFRGGYGGFGSRGSGSYHDDRQFTMRENANVSVSRTDERAERENRRSWSDKGDRTTRSWNEGRDGRDRDSDRDRRRDEDRGEKRRSRWDETDDRSGSRWDGRDRHRSERDDRDRERRDRDRDRDRESDRRRDRDKSERGERSRRDREDRERHRPRERGSPRYEDPPSSQSQMINSLPNGSEETMVTSTTDVELVANAQPSYSLDCAEHTQKLISNDENVMEIEHSAPSAEV